nr:Protein of unknown function DUF1266 [uncultured organism]
MTTQEKGTNIILYGVPNPEDYDIVGPRITLNEGPKRALATGAILFYNGGQPMKRLVPLKPEQKSKHLAQLAEWWGIESAPDARRCLADLYDYGHRAVLQPRFAQNEAYWREKFDMSDFLRGRPVTSVAGWDYARIVNLAYWTRNVGLLDDDSAFYYFDAGARLALERFSSWEELAVSFLAGRFMWNPEDLDGHQHLGAIANYLLNSPHNVWQECPWQQYETWWDQPLPRIEGWGSRVE